MTYIIDRFEEDVAVLECSDRTTVEVPLTSIPKGAKEGDCLIETGGIFTVDKTATAALRREIDGLIDDVFK